LGLYILYQVAAASQVNWFI